jgi:DNA-binding HxlR family transcriptional regulator
MARRTLNSDMAIGGLTNAIDQPAVRGEEIPRLLSDGRIRTVVRELASGPRRPCQLDQLPGLARSTLYLRLGHLADLGFLTRRRVTEFPLRTEYSLTKIGRVALAHELLIDRERHSRIATTAPSIELNSSLEDILRLLAPLALLPAGLRGLCTLEELSARSPPRKISLSINDVIRVGGKSVASPSVLVAGTLATWDDALLSGSHRGLEIVGDVRIATITLAAISATLRA